MSKTLARKFLEFAEEIQDPEFDPSTLENTEFDDADSFEEPAEVTPVNDTEATIGMEDDGAAVTVVTPKGTSVSVTESVAKAFSKSKWFNLICESAGGANIIFSTADVNAFQSGATMDEIIERRIAKSWNEPQGIKNAFNGSVNEDVKKVNEEEEGDDFFGDEEESKEEGELNLEDIKDEPITADLSVEGDKIVIDNIELKDKVEEDPSLDTPTRDEEEKDEIVIGDPIGEALQKAKELKKDATFTGDVSDAEKPAMKVQTTNGVVDKKKVQEQPEKK